MKFKYLMPTDMYFGDNVVLENKEIFATTGKRALIVTGKNSAKINGSYNDVVEALLQVEVDYILFDQVEENPSLETIEKASVIGRENKVDFVIGIGGGSPMDAAKAIALFIKNPEVNKDNIFCKGQLGSIPVIAIPTTSGTGSEVTQYSIVTSNKEKTKKNLGQSIFPKAAFLDSKYTYNLPYDITVSTFIDAFTHLVEGYLNKNSTVMSKIYGEKGFKLISLCFNKLISRELDKEFRDNAMLVSALAGIQIAQSGTSLPHGMGYPLTYFKGLPHGLANGVLTMEYLKSFRNQKEINNMLGFMGLDNLDRLDDILKKLIDVDIDITSEEIEEYAISFYSNKSKLRSHTENVGYEDILRIYTNSLL